MNDKSTITPMKTQAQRNAEFMRRMYRGGKNHDRKMTRLSWTLIAYACAFVAVAIYFIS